MSTPTMQTVSYRGCFIHLSTAGNTTTARFNGVVYRSLSAAKAAVTRTVSWPVVARTGSSQP